MSAFEVVMGKTLTIMQQGRPRELNIEEALQLKTYQAALSGNRPARREILKMIAKREQWLTKHHPGPPMLVERVKRFDPDNANEAMVILGIAIRADQREPRDEYDRLKLAPWAVEAALARPGGRRISARDLSESKRCTADPATIRWPEPLRD